MSEKNGFLSRNNIFLGLKSKVLTPKGRCFTASIHPPVEADGFLEAFNNLEAKDSLEHALVAELAYAIA